ncbi:hypothetical protein JXB41_08760, partial [Candidatus Woesearchaeota archaeon]|nr:hypothetical protein [Candidatus Woesearchaeota archaeon]
MLHEQHVNYFNALRNIAGWDLDIDFNDNQIPCDCCLCQSGIDGNKYCKPSLIQECLITGKSYICDDGVDDGFAWKYMYGDPELTWGILDDLWSPGTGNVPTGEDVTEKLKDCTANNVIITGYPEYIYLNWEDLKAQIFVNEGEPDTEFVDSIDFSIKYRTENTVIHVQWFDFNENSWKPVLDCGPFSSQDVFTEQCTLPEQLKDAILAGNYEDVLLRLIINHKDNTVEKICNDNIDNDVDGLVDCEDNDCTEYQYCKPRICGDGIVQDGEACDDGNPDDCDGCRRDCSAVETGCGDGFVCPPEAC